MQIRERLKRAEEYRTKMETSLSSVNKALQDLFGDENVHVFYQASDGWVIFFGGDYNAPIGDIDFDALLKMDKDDALQQLMYRSI